MTLGNKASRPDWYREENEHLSVGHIYEQWLNYQKVISML